MKEAIKNLYDLSIEKKALCLKNIYDRKIALLEASNSSFLDCPCSSSFKFFDVALPNSETSIVNLSEFVEYDRITSKEARKHN